MNVLPRTGATERQRDQAINELIEGRSNATGEVTLTPNATTTVVSKSTINANAAVLLFPKTAAAVADVGTTYATITPGGGSFTVTHANAAGTDRVFYYLVAGG